MNEKISKPQRSLLNFSKKHLLPNDKLDVSIDGKRMQFICQQVEGCDLRLFVLKGTICIGMFTYYDHNAKWVDETEWAYDCYAGGHYVEFKEEEK